MKRSTSKKVNGYFTFGKITIDQMKDVTSSQYSPHQQKTHP